MDMEYLKRREQESLLRRRVLQAEQERLEEAETMSVSEARDGLRERIIEEKPKWKEAWIHMNY